MMAIMTRTPERVPRTMPIVVEGVFVVAASDTEGDRGVRWWRGVVGGWKGIGWESDDAVLVGVEVVTVNFDRGSGVSDMAFVMGRPAGNGGMSPMLNELDLKKTPVEYGEIRWILELEYEQTKRTIKDARTRRSLHTY